MCNEIEEKKVFQHRVTITNVNDDDAIKISLHPSEPDWKPGDITFGEVKKSELIRNGIDAELYSEFLWDHWEAPDGAIRSEYRPIIRRRLTDAECEEIRREVEKETEG